MYSSQKQFFKSRKISIIAFGTTLLVLVSLFLFGQQDANILAEQYQINLSALRVFYICLSLFLGAVFFFEPQIRDELAVGLGLTVFLAGGISFLAVGLNIPPQERRLLPDYPFTVWLVIVHTVFLGSLAVGLAIRQHRDPPGQRVRRYALVVSGVLGLATLLLYILSVGRFMLLDIPDEPELGSLATSYAATGLLDRTFIGSAYGTPDPVAPRYYVLMGSWIRAAGSSLVALRVFPLIVGLVALGLVAFALLQVASLGWHQRIIGLAAMVGFSALIRSSHNIRQDIGLAVYGALELIALILYENQRRKFWLMIVGLTLYIGLETVPTIALLFAVVVSLPLIPSLVMRPVKREGLLALLFYGLGCVAALVIYILVRLPPDAAVSIRNFIDYYRYYQGLGNLNVVPSSNRVFDYYGRFSLILSPIELIALTVCCFWFFRSVSQTERRIGFVGIVGVLVAVLFTRSYGYLALFAPFIAYMVAHTCRSQGAVIIGAFVLLPALLSAPIHDMAAAIQADLPQRRLAEVDLLTWRIPEQTTVVGNDVFWYTLNYNRRFVGWTGLSAFARAKGMSLAEALNALNVDYVICLSPDDLCNLAMNDKFEPPIDFKITEGLFLVLKRRG